jgi:hypothetical protein
MRRLRLTVVLAALALVVVGVVAGYVIAQSGGATVTRDALAQSTKVKGAKGKTLGSAARSPSTTTRAPRSPTSSPAS